MARGFVVVLDGRQPACVLRLAAHHFLSPPFYRFSTVSTIEYIYGDPSLGMTASIYAKHGYEAVYRVTNYLRGAFDGYDGQPVLCMDSYNCGFPLSDLLTYLDGFPLELPCRFVNRWAAYDTVYLVSTLPLTDQYKDEQFSNPSVWQAFLRRLTAIIEFLPENNRIYYTVDDDYQIVPRDADDTTPAFAGMHNTDAVGK